MQVPRPIARLIESFQRLPGIGPKTAQRLTFMLLHFPQEDLERFADALIGLKRDTQLCTSCKNVSEAPVCSICSSATRNKRLIAVVSSPLDVFAIERAGFSGVYHVLHGIIDPLNNIGPEDIFINDLKDRIHSLYKEDSSSSIEVLLATNTSMEGESTALYIVNMLRESGLSKDILRITRIARGLPVGGDIEYADNMTLSRALEGRIDY